MNLFFEIGPTQVYFKPSRSASVILLMLVETE